MKKVPKSSENFRCEKCDFNTSRESQLTRHLSTPKHQNRTFLNEKVPKSSEIKFSCEDCGKTYKARNSLWYHKQKCNAMFINNTNADLKVDKDLVMTILKQNSELQTQMIELLKNGTHNTNSNNKTFNLQLFLNETCKDAMNITDFVNNIQLQLSDLEKMGEIGYVNGISNIIVKNLKDMDISSRPIHCTDIKREVMYIKDEDKWDKDLNNNPKVRNAIKHIAHKNSKLLIEFQERHPDYNNSASKVSDQYNKLLIESMGGKGDNDVEKENKIIRNISKEIIVEKE
jgi:predicted RNA-binding Zn-ribbon protein involved in translation (DUF1610 family)